MRRNKEQIASAIARAQTSLVEARLELENIPSFDLTSVRFHAHAINNYLNVIGGIVDLIMTKQPKILDVQVNSWLEEVQHAADMMTSAVHNLMSASSSTDIELRCERINDFQALIQRVCGYYQRVANRKMIRVVANTSANVPLVWTDRIAALAVLDNLMSNAVKYSERGKQISVQVQSETNWLVCSVRDEGPGLSPDDQTRLFQKGTRLTPKPTGNESSTGYGLAVAKELIEKLGGKIWCESVQGQGSCFSFRLPAYKPEEMPDRAICTT